MNLKKFASAAAIVTLSTASHAGILFSDDFDTDTLALNAQPAGWDVSSGTVDIHGAPNYWDVLPGHGRYVDLDGSTMQGGTLTHSLWLAAGAVYSASFDLAGNNRSGGNETVTASFGSTQSVYTLAETAPFSTYLLNFTPTASGLYSLSFTNAGGDNQGAFLDNVSISSVPEPQTYALMAAGVLALGFLARRRAPR